MATWFYTDTEATQQGPVDEPTLLDLSREGALKAKSLVWQEGMPAWVPLRTVAAGLYERAGRGGAVEIGVCAHSGQVYPIREMLPYGEALIGPEHKEEFVQWMMETAAIEIADASHEPPAYAGFWWRALASVLDYMIKMVPSGLCMIPYYVVAVAGGANSGGEEVIEGLDSWTALMLAAYGLGLLGVLALSIFYETWMVGKYQGTLGKIIIGVKVVNPDGTRLTYKRAFIRWLAKKPLNYLLVWGPSTLGFAAVIGLIIGVSQGGGENSSAFVLTMFTGFFVYAALLAFCSGVYWMAGLDPEKRAFHDRIASTRVMKK
ncbi:MAG: RDD family protein [Verrucomicrobiales bacterium]